MWQLADKTLSSRLLLGTARYPSLENMREAIVASQTNVITVALRRHLSHGEKSSAFFDYIQSLGCYILPNTAGCRSVEEAITVAEMSREIFKTHWIKLEVIGDDYTLQPDPFGLLT